MSENREAKELMGLVFLFSIYNYHSVPRLAWEEGRTE
jgi:hypothetical protein